MNLARHPFVSSKRFKAIRSSTRASLVLLLSFIVLFVSVKGWGAPPPQQGGTPADQVGRLSIEMAGTVTWRVAGHVTTLKGEPVGGTQIAIDLGDIGTQPKRILQTDLQGRFQADYELANVSPKLKVRVTAKKAGYRPAIESVEFPARDKAWVIQVILRKKEGEEDLIPPLTELVAALAPKLLTAATQDKEINPQRKEFQQGTEKFVNRHKSREALPDLEKVVRRWPKCAACRTMLGLAELDAGSWVGALEEINEAAKSDRLKDLRLGTPLVILGVVEEWRGNPGKAATFFSQALAIEPDDPLALREMGRALMAQRDWQAASQPLEKAVKAGTSPEARVMLARVQYELGRNEEAEAELARYREDRKTTTPPPAARYEYVELEKQLELEARNKIAPLVSEPLPEIQKALPELQTLEPVPNQAALPEILRRTGDCVDVFFRTFPNTISREDVVQQRLGKKGKVSHSLDQTFQYLIIIQAGKSTVNVEEFRGDSGGQMVSVANPDGRFMLTSGFASQSLIFHPAYQPYTKFRYLGTQSLNDRKTVVVAFAQTTQNIAILVCFTVGNTTTRILQQGVAWIDAETFQILRLRTDLLKPQSELKLLRQTTDMTYDQVQFKEEPRPLWLPREVAVTVEMRDRSWHNLHRYSDFRLFRIDTKDKITVPQVVDSNPPAAD